MAALTIKDLAAKFCRKDDPVMAKSVLTPGFEQQHALGPYYKSKRITKEKKRKEKNKTKGEDWFNMPATELTDEIKADLKAIRMRDVLDPARFYKPPDTKGLPKYFQVGKIVDNPADFYSSRIPKRLRKRTIVEELLQDAEFRKTRKRRAAEIFKKRHENLRYYKRRDKKAAKNQKSNGEKNSKKTVSVTTS